MSHIGELQKQYWTEFRVYLAASGSKLEPMGNPLPLSWHAFRLNRPDERIETVITSRGETRIELYLTGTEAKQKFDKLRNLYEADSIKTLGKIVWPKDEHKRKKAYLINEASLNDKTKWPQQFEWLANQLQKMHAYFLPKLKTL